MIQGTGVHSLSRTLCPCASDVELPSLIETTVAAGVNTNIVGTIDMIGIVVAIARVIGRAIAIDVVAVAVIVTVTVTAAMIGTDRTTAGIDTTVAMMIDTIDDMTS
jgi:hypothetical protein